MLFDMAGFYGSPSPLWLEQVSSITAFWILIRSLFPRILPLLSSKCSLFDLSSCPPGPGDCLSRLDEEEGSSDPGLGLGRQSGDFALEAFVMRCFRVCKLCA